ncbi:hypothetical protein NIES2107_54420 [Nostoc carneum NIES-2107]|nr:hypothetical protein NIES2107_54420 [Nostoc carneum NIES-2107]
MLASKRLKLPKQFEKFRMLVFCRISVYLAKMISTVFFVFLLIQTMFEIDTFFVGNIYNILGYQIILLMPYPYYPSVALFSQNGITYFQYSYFIRFYCFSAKQVISERKALVLMRYAIANASYINFKN